MEKSEINVEVCFIHPVKQFLKQLQVLPGTTIQQAISLSGLSQEFPGIDFNQLKVGIYSKLKTADSLLRDHDRVEVYRSLEVDPMTARRRRAEKKS